jgi:Ca2+-binding RTX toxin-like protein
MTNIVASAEFVGFDGSRSIYRVDLAQAPWSTVQAISFVDDGVRSGGTGGASGFDLDFVGFFDRPYTLEDFPAAASGSSDLGAEVIYSPGYIARWYDGNLGSWDTSHLFGTRQGNFVDAGRATLGTADGDDDGRIGTLSLGEAGQISLLFNNPITTGADGSTKQYLYFADFGSRSEYADALKVVLSNERSALPYSGNLTLWGDERSETIALGQGNNTHNGGGNDMVFGLGGNDSIMTAGGQDKLYGGEGNDRLHGQSGRDTLHGERGDDQLFGGANNDLLYGGVGNDVFVFNAPLGTWKTDRNVNFDRIADFNVKQDSIWLDNDVFRKLGKKGSEDSPAQLKKAFFQIGQADDRNDYILYNKKTGILSYDPDGSGARKAIEIAKLDKNLKMTYKDFFII